MKRNGTFFLSLFCLFALVALTLKWAEGRKEPASHLIEADSPLIQYTGRIDFSNPKRPRFWAPGVYIRAKFKGPSCSVVIGDEVLWGKSHNFLEIVVDNGKPFRVQTTGKNNTITVARGLSGGEHTVTICKDTEAGIGYLELVGFRCAGLVPLPAKPTRKLEFIGDSITCGMGSDLSNNPCGKGEWYDQHNAYRSYGAITARRLNAQWHLTARSGIGLMHSCCDMKEVMPDVWDTIALQTPSKKWDVRKYQPDALVITLGQNDGEQEPGLFQAKYAEFLRTVRKAYPRAQIVCLSSPMGSPTLQKYQKENLTRLVNEQHRAGDGNVHMFFFSRGYNNGCGGHPDLSDHEKIALELIPYLKTTLKW